MPLVDLTSTTITSVKGLRVAPVFNAENILKRLVTEARTKFKSNVQVLVDINSGGWRNLTEQNVPVIVTGIFFGIDNVKTVEVHRVDNNKKVKLGSIVAVDNTL